MKQFSKKFKLNMKAITNDSETSVLTMGREFDS